MLTIKGKDHSSLTKGLEEFFKAFVFGLYTIKAFRLKFREDKIICIEAFGFYFMMEDVSFFFHDIGMKLVWICDLNYQIVAIWMHDVVALFDGFHDECMSFKMIF